MAVPAGGDRQTVGHWLAGAMVIGLVAAIGVMAVAGTPLAPGDLESTALENNTATIEIPNSGESYAVGFPVSVNGTLGETFINGTDGISAVFTYDDGWDLRQDFASISPGTRDAIAVTTTGTGPDTITMEVKFNDESGGIGQPDPGMSVEAGWNFMSAYGCDNAQSSFLTNPETTGLPPQDETLLIFDPFEGPNSPDRDPVSKFHTYIMDSFLWGENSPAVDPFKGYFSYYTTSTEILALEDPENLC